MRDIQVSEASSIANLYQLNILYVEMACGICVRFPPLLQVIDVVPKESKLKIGRLNNLGFENQKIKE